MNDSVTGRAIGTDAIAAQKDVADKFWFDWRPKFPGMAPDQQAIVLSWLSLQLAQAGGNATITHAPGWDLVDFDPSAGTHQDPASDALSFNRPPPALAQQVDGSGLFVALWLKVGDGANDWVAVGGAGADRKVASGPTDPGADTLIAKVESLDGSLTISEDTANHRVNFGVTPAPDDHKVKRDVDATPVYGDQLLVSPNGSIGQVNDPESDSIDIQVVCASDLPLPDAPVASAGDPNDQPSSKRHVHPLVPPDTYGGKLWTGLVPDQYKHADVDACFIGYYACGAPILLSAGWTQIATGVWQKNETGDLSLQFTDQITPFVGMRLLVWPAYNPQWLSAADRVASGIYVLTDTGTTYVDPITHVFTPHHATLQRADDAKTTAQVFHGIWVHVAGGAVLGGQNFQLDTADPIELNVTQLDWESVSPAPSVNPTDELLTAAQLSLASPTTVEVDQDVSSSSGEVELVVCTEHDAALAGTTLPGDKPWRFHLFCCLIGSDDPAATTVINCYLRGSLDAAWHLVATTQSLHNTVYGMMVEAGTLGADYAMGAGEKLQARFTAASTSTIGQTVGLVFNDAAHSTFIDVPVTIGNAGTDDHSQLIKRNVLNADGTGQHQRRFVDDVALPPISLDGSGNLIPDPSSNIVLFDSEVTVNRIDKSQWPTGVGRLTLLFPQKGHVGNSAGPSGSFAEVQMGNFGGLSGAQGEQADFGYDGLINLLLIAGAWNLDGAPNMGRSML